MKRKFLLLGLICLASTAGAEDIYKNVDAKGRASFSDRPSQGAQKVNVDVRPANADDAVRITRERNEATVYNARVHNSQQNEAQNLAQQEQNRQRRQNYCNHLRDSQRTFNEGGLIYRLDEQGKRTFYSAQDIERRRAEIAAEIEHDCAG